ncbi:MAG TPA: hypothetical protein PLP56_08165, partial [Candidatus Omnitrophota bacterium]|nr:hypothetical protein [Candidatus Omnitrophota bacterium]
MDDKAWDVSRNYLKQFKPEDLKAVYGMDNVEDIIKSQQGQAKKGLALSEAAGEGLLGITPTQPQLKKEYPVATTATQIGAGVLPYLLPGGTIAKFTGIPAVQEIISQATNPDEQLSEAQRAGRVGASAAGGFITGKIFGQADLGKTIFSRVLQRSAGAGSTAITENILKDAISGHAPDAKNALINGGINAASIGILGALVEVPQLRSAVIREGSRIAGKPVQYKEAVKIVKGNMINPETLSPTFQEAQYQTLRAQAIKQIETETGKSITDRALKDYLVQRNAQDRANIFDNQAAAEIKFAKMKGIDPANGFYARLLPYRELIINGADPVDVYMSMRLADNLRPVPPVVQTVEKPVEPPKPPEIVEAEKAGKVIGIDKKTKLPIVDTAQKPVVPESTPITPSAPATVVSNTPQTPAQESPAPAIEKNAIVPVSPAKEAELTEIP